MYVFFLPQREKRIYFRENEGRRARFVFVQSHVPKVTRDNKRLQTAFALLYVHSTSTISSEIKPT